MSKNHDKLENNNQNEESICKSIQDINEQNQEDLKRKRND